MKTVRLSPDLQVRLQRAAEAAGMTESELIREAIARRCDEVLAQRLDLQLADVIGIGSGPPDLSGKTGQRFTRMLAGKKRPTPRG